jgi:ATP-dependent Clp protease ATP-binding subunit ClpA
MKAKIMASLKGTFRPEFLNRIDEIVVFHPLSKSVLERIANAELAKLDYRLSEKGISIEWSDAVRKYLAEKGYDPLYGARPLKRVIQNEILDVLEQLFRLVIHLVGVKKAPMRMVISTIRGLLARRGSFGTVSWEIAGRHWR